MGGVYSNDYFRIAWAQWEEFTAMFFFFSKDKMLLLGHNGRSLQQLKTRCYCLGTMGGVYSNE